jgi:hypothetical protein
MRKAQMIGQIFIFIIAAIVFVLVLMYGYSAITNFLKSSEQVSLIEFKLSLRSGVEQIKPDFGSVRKLVLYVPKRFHTMCVVSSDTDVHTDEFQSRFPILFESWQTGSENVFLVPKQESPIFVPDVVVVDGYFCIPVTGGIINLRLESLGDKVEVSQW